MNTSLTGYFFQLPSVRQFLGLLSDELARCRSLLVLLPQDIEPATVWSALRGELFRRDFAVREVSISELPDQSSPAAALGQALGVTWPSSDTPRTIANLIATGNLPEVILLEDLHSIPQQERERWLEALVQWGQESATLIDRGERPPTLCILVPARAILPHVPDTSVTVSVHWWWGFPSSLELRLICRLGEDDGPSTAVANWREHVLPAIAGNDISLMEWLWDSAHLKPPDLADHMLSFAKKYKWSADALKNWGVDEFHATRWSRQGQLYLSPPPACRLLWAEGSVCYSVEHGLELHPAALLAMGWEEEFRHRLWRGQSALLLPLVDQTRLSLCEHLTQRYGTGWPVKWCQPPSPEEEAAVRESPFAVQWGYLEWLLRNCHQLRGERRWLGPASLARWIRNELAHYRTVSFSSFEGIWRQMDSPSKRGGPSP